MWEVRERLLGRVRSYVDVCCLNAAHGGGKVGASYLYGAVVSGLKSGTALVGGHVDNQWARSIGFSTINEGATCVGAAQDP